MIYLGKRRGGRGGSKDNILQSAMTAQEEYYNAAKEFFIVPEEESTDVFIKGTIHWMIGCQVTLNKIFPLDPNRRNFKFKHCYLYITTLVKNHTLETLFLQGSNFKMYDKWGNEVSNYTLDEYIQILRGHKIDEIIHAN